MTVERREEGTSRGENTPSHHCLPPKKAWKGMEEVCLNNRVALRTQLKVRVGSHTVFTYVVLGKLLNLSFPQFPNL